ncbi:MAG TPA: GNAT family N-acetyltransferase [Candidatus Cybelea sp.]|nr:GNAT family N-acetyltransferase [Candidatus Cybelea sp.]
MTIPVIETPRLRLRAHRSADLPDCVDLWSDPLVTKYISGRASTEHQTWMRLLSYAGLWALVGFGYWAIEEKSSNGFAGEVGFADFKREGATPLGGNPELGFVIASPLHGKGYATEAVGAALAWADAHLPSGTVCMVSRANYASRRVVEKCGYKVFERSIFREQPVLFLARESGASTA